VGRTVQTLALGAALVALALGVWRDYGVAVAVKRTVIAYLAAYFLAGGVGLAARAALRASRDPEPDPEPEPDKPRRRRRPLPATQAAPAAETAGEDAARTSEPSPEPIEAG
jgi:hypothetical protein